MLDHVCDCVAMRRSQQKRLQNQHVQRALEDFIFRFGRHPKRLYSGRRSMGRVSCDDSDVEQIALSWGPEPNLYSVSELTQSMRGLLMEHFTDIWVAGEISGTRIPSSGHYYFTLKDEIAQLKCVCYKMTARY